MKESAKVAKEVLHGSVKYVNVSISGVSFDVTGNTVTFNLPCIEMPKFHGPFIDREFCDWTREQGIPESVFSDAYEAAREEMYRQIRLGCAFQVLKESSVISQQ